MHDDADLSPNRTDRRLLEILQGGGAFRSVKDWPEVLGCHALTDDMDYMLRVQLADLDNY